MIILITIKKINKTTNESNQYIKKEYLRIVKLKSMAGYAEEKLKDPN